MKPAVLVLLCMLGLFAGATSAAEPASPRIDTLHLDAPGIDPEGPRVRVFLPPGYDANRQPGYPVLYVNDGQDAEAVALQPWLDALTISGEIRPVIAVAIDMPRDRMGAYGLSDRARARSVVADTKYGPVGTRAQAYSEWLAHTLVPFVDAHYRTRHSRRGRAVVGWSLGALNAFNLGWNYPELFATVGAFSPSFWLSADNRDADAVQATRIVHVLVDGSEPMQRPQLFFGVGTNEETDDRDGDGVIDQAYNYSTDVQMTTARANRIQGYPTSGSSSAPVDFDTLSSNDFNKLEGIFSRKFQPFEISRQAAHLKVRQT